jgi:hypothetical protein
MLDAGDGGKDQDKFKTAVIDTLVAMVQGVPGEDRCIILVGYEDKMIDMFHNVNPGLSRRFPIANPFRFDNFSLPQLLDILEKKLGEQDLEATPEAMGTARDVLERSLMRPNFPNAGEIDSLLSIAKTRYERRQALQPPGEQDFHGKLEPEDFDKDYKRGTQFHVNTLQELDGRVHQSIIEKLASYQAQSLGARRLGLKPRDQVPTNFVFKGPAGTGKTTAAEHMGKLYYNMGFLATPEVISCSAGELIGKYVGHTGPQTRRTLQKAIGKVLFIDEAFRLCYGGEFGAQAVDEIIQFLTRPSNTGRIVVILAGYKRDMDLLMTMFPALSGLFHEDITFEVLEPAECITLLLRELRLKHVPVEPDFLMDPAAPGYIKAARLFNGLRAMPDWASARDVKEVAKWIVNKFLEESSQQDTQAIGAVTLQQVHDCIFKLIVHKRGRLLTLKANANAALPTQPPIASGHVPSLAQAVPAAPAVATSTETSSELPAASHSSATATRMDIQPAAHARERRIDQQQGNGNERRGSHSETQPPSASREEATSDAEWLELETAKEERHERLRRADRLQRDLDAAENEILQASQGPSGGGGNCDGLNGRCDALRDELSAVQKMMQKEKKAQARLKAMGRCENGFEWLHVAGGWRCAGGMHYVPDQDVMAGL